MLQFYTYRLAIHKEFSAIHHSKKLLQQYLVDAHVKVESQCLDYICRNQQQLRVERYQGLMDQLNSRAEESNLRYRSRAMSQVRVSKHLLAIE